MSRLEAALRRAQTLNHEADRAALRPEPTPIRAELTPIRPEPTLIRPEPTLIRPEPTPIRHEPAAAHDRDAEARKASAVASITRAVPRTQQPAADGLKLTGASADKLVVTNRPEQSTVEQYRKLAATLHHAQVERD